MNQSILPLGNITPIKTTTKPSLQTTEMEGRKNFADTLKTALNKVSEAEHVSNVKTEMLAKGQPIDLHDVMITAQKASITVETAVQIQQKVIDAYNEVMRMQI